MIQHLHPHSNQVETNLERKISRTKAKRKSKPSKSYCPEEAQRMWSDKPSQMVHYMYQFVNANTISQNFEGEA